MSCCRTTNWVSWSQLMCRSGTIFHWQVSLLRNLGDFLIPILTPFSGKASLDQVVSKACRQFSPAGFEYVLSLLDGALSSDLNDSIDSSELVHLGSILLRDHPPSQSCFLRIHDGRIAHYDCLDTLKIMQAFFTRCMDIYTDHEKYTAVSAGVRLQTLEFVAQHCSERVRKRSFSPELDLKVSHSLRPFDRSTLAVYGCFCPSACRHHQDTRRLPQALRSTRSLPSPVPLSAFDVI